MAEYKRKKVKKVKLGKTPNTKKNVQKMPKEKSTEIKMQKNKRDVSVSNYNREAKREKANNFKVIKGNKTRNKQRKMSIIALVVAVIVLCVFVNSLTPVGIIEEIHNNVAKIGAGELPATLESSDIKNISGNNSIVYVLSDTNLELYNQGGKRTLNVQHGYLRPGISISQSRGLIYDRGGKNYRTFNNSEILYEAKLENAIYSADISRCGKYVFSSETSGYTSKVSVFSKNNKSIFSLLVADNIVADVLLNNSGNRLATSEIYTKGGQFVSKISVYTLDSSTPKFSFEIEGAAVASLVNLKNSFAAVSEDKIIIFKWSNGDKTECETNGDILNYCSDLNGNFVYVTGRDNDYSTAKVIVYRDSKRINEFLLKFSATDISVYKNRVFILNSQNIYVYESKNGKLVNSLTTDFTSSDICALSKKSAVAVSQSKMSVLK